jgi:hypothetical protein
MKRKFFVVFSILFIALLVIFPEIALEGAKSGMQICASFIIPTLLPFMVIMQVLMSAGISKYLGGGRRVAFIFGLVSGYPMGAKIVCELYRNGEIDKKSAQRMCAYCNNCGPMFVLGAVGAGIYQSAGVGWALYIAHVISAIVMAFVLKNKTCARGKTLIKQNKFDILNPINSILIVCAYIIIFSTGLRFLEIFGIRSGFLVGLFEMTRGIYLSQHNLAALPAIAFILTFGGACIILQTREFLKSVSLSVIPYIIYKIPQALFASLFTFLIIKFLPISKNAFSGEYPPPHVSSLYAYSLALCVICVILCFVFGFFLDRLTTKTLHDKIKK